VTPLYTYTMPRVITQSRSVILSFNGNAIGFDTIKSLEIMISCDARYFALGNAKEGMTRNVRNDQYMRASFN
jgi:hypothetical protein